MSPKMLRATFALALLCASTVASAQDPYIDLQQRLTPEQLREVGLTSTQLDLLNRMLRAADAREAAARPPAPAVIANTDVAAKTDEGHVRHGSSTLIGLNDEPIRSRLKGTVAGWDVGTVFELENGQQWKVLKGHLTLPKPLQNPPIVVVPGVAGRWFLQVDADMPKARVYRID